MNTGSGTLPLATNPLLELSRSRAAVLAETVSRTVEDFSDASLDLALGEALYSERRRLKRAHSHLFTRARTISDRRLWSQVQSGLLRPSSEADRKAMLEQVARHYSEEIGGTFSPQVYRFATSVVPYGFNWFLNAVSVRHFMPWKWTESLQSQLQILGEVPALQKLARKGTILLVPTHQSNIDSILLGYVIYRMGLPPFAYGAGLNLFSNPVFSFFMNNLGAYKVDRQKDNLIYKQSLKNYSTRILREGIHSIFFPGGGRSRSGAIEKHLKLGLLGTALQAQLQNLKSGHPKPNVYIVPMVMSYHFVLEASSLIEDYLTEAGKHRFLSIDEDSWQALRISKFFWKLFASQSGMVARIGKPLDVFGNFVDEEGCSVGPNGNRIDPARWLTTRGELRPDSQRDQEYTRELGTRLVERYHRENTVLSSHAAAFTLFETLREKYPELDLFRFLRLSLPQRSLPYGDFMAHAGNFQRKLVALEQKGELHLSEELKSGDLEKWVSEGIRQLGLFHEAAVIRVQDGAIWTEDMNLLYYYRNRITGYHLSLLVERNPARNLHAIFDEKGFLA